jgi:lysophospholipase L1-like esterase
MFLKGIEMARSDAEGSPHARERARRGHGSGSLGAALVLGAAHVCGVGVLSSTAGNAAPAAVLGDSIGVGVSMAGGVPRLARNSVSIRSADVFRQLSRLAPGTVAFLSLGTNDAVGSIAGVERGVDRIVQAARSAGVRLVWIGPPCVIKPWNTNVVKLDSILSRRLAGQVAYVSIADPELCDRSLRGADGVHFNMRGYSLLWERARAAAGAGIEAAELRPDEPADHKARVPKPRHRREGRRPDSQALSREALARVASDPAGSAAVR